MLLFSHISCINFQDNFWKLYLFLFLNKIRTYLKKKTLSNFWFQILLSLSNYACFTFFNKSKRTNLTVKLKAEILLLCHFEKWNHDSLSF